jgi:hypothetical protein
VRWIVFSVLIAQKFVFNANGVLQHAVPVSNFVVYPKKSCFRFG